MEDNRNFLDTYKKYISTGWYGDSISNTVLDRWYNNFSNITGSSFDPKICANFLLHALVFYQDRQLTAIISSIEAEIKSQLNELNEQNTFKRLSENELSALWEKYKGESYIVAAASPNDAAGSAYHATRLWRNASGIDTGTINSLVEQICEKGKKHIFFVDDFIGTGTKMLEFLTVDHFPFNKPYGFTNIKEVIEKYKNDVDFNISVFAMCIEGKQKIDDNFPGLLNYYYGDLYTDDYNLINDSCVLYDAFSNNKTQIIDYILKIKQRIGENKYELNLPIAFNHGCPNNTLSLYYKKTDFWTNLLSESHPQNS